MKTYSGTMTDHTRKRIGRAIDMLLQISPLEKKYNPVTNKVIKHRLSFITLTVHSPKKMLTPKEGYDTLLMPFLRYFRDKEIMTSYIWKAEAQKRGQLHYHITTPSIIPYDTIKKYWNKLQEKAGLLDDYYKVHHHYNPNSTDIHSVKEIKDFGKYLAKEFCKTVQNETPTSGKLWDCSINIKGAKYFSTELDNAIGRNILQAHKHGHLKTLELDKCTVLKLKNMKSFSLLTPVEKSSYNEYLKTLRNKTKDNVKTVNHSPINHTSTHANNNLLTNSNAKTMEKNIKPTPKKTSVQLTNNQLLAPIDREQQMKKVKTKKPI